MATLQQIEEEIQREVRIEKRIENIKKKFLKHNRKYRLVETKDKAHAFLVLNRNDLSTFHLISYEEEETISKLENNPELVVFLLKNTNPHDSRKTTNGDIRKNLTPSARITTQKS